MINIALLATFGIVLVLAIMWAVTMRYAANTMEKYYQAVKETADLAHKILEVQNEQSNADNR